jgi:leucyl-tRNA synthetase
MPRVCGQIAPNLCTANRHNNNICRRNTKTSTHLIIQNNLLNNERNCERTRQNKRTNIKKQMIESIIYLLLIIAPSFALGYYARSLQPIKSTAKTPKKSKQKEILPPIN